MKYRYIITALLLLVAGNSALTAAVVIHNRTAGIDLSDIIREDKREYTVLEVKQLCAEITGRYHSSGYTAFYIRDAVIRRDGTVELTFNESRVTGLRISGDGISPGILNELYTMDDIFNELVLRGNIKSVKEKYSLEKISADVERTADGNVELIFSAVRKRFTGEVEVSTVPLYGAYAGAGLTVNDVASVFCKTTLRGESAGYTSAGLGLSFPLKSSGVFMNIDYASRDDAADDGGGSFYSSSTAGINAGFFRQHGALALKLYLLSSYVDYGRYDEYEEGVSLTGAGFSAVYDDSGYKIDKSDASAAGIEISAGRNISNEYTALRSKFYAAVNFPLISPISLTFGFNSEYTAEDERLLQFYVFDEKIPLRREDYTVAEWRNSARAGLKFEAVPGLLFIVPEYIAAFYGSGGESRGADGYGLRCIVRTDYFRFEASCACERGRAVKDGVLIFSASGSF